MKKPNINARTKNRLKTAFLAVAAVGSIGFCSAGYATYASVEDGVHYLEGQNYTHVEPTGTTVDNYRYCGRRTGTSQAYTAEDSTGKPVEKTLCRGFFHRIS